MENHVYRIAYAFPDRRIATNRHADLFDELLAAFASACILEEPVLAEGLLGFLDDILRTEDLADPVNLPRLERVVEARFHLLEVKFGMRQRRLGAV